MMALCVCGVVEANGEGLDSSILTDAQVEFWRSMVEEQLYNEDLF